MADQQKKSGKSGGSRRDFIRTSSVVVGGALAGGLSAAQTNVARAATAAGSDHLKIGLIGCGGRGGGAVGDTLRANQGVTITAMADAFENNVEGKYKALKGQHGDRMDVPKDRRFHGFDAYQKVIDSGVDMVILATPPGFRPIHFEAAIKAGKHVFMEKPVATDAPGIRKVLEVAKLAKKKGLGVGVGLQRRHQKHYLEAIGRIHDGAIGDVMFARVYWNGGGVWTRPRKPGQTEMQYQMRNWYYFNWLCGDHITEQHIHNLDVGNWIMDGFPESAQGMGGRQVRVGKEHGEIYDHHYVEFTYSGGRKVFSHCRHIPGCWSAVNEHAHGTKGTASMSSRDASLMVGDARERFRGSPNPYVVEHADLVASIRAGKPYVEAEYGAKSTMTSILGRMATYSGKMVPWDKAINSKINLQPENYAWDAKAPVLPDENGNYSIAVPGQSKVV